MWLINKEALMKLEQAQAAGLTINAEQREQFALSAASPDRIMKTAGSVADVHVNGILTPAPDFIAAFFGGGNTTYPEIIGAINAANADDNIKTIRMVVNSPGGSISGMFEAMEAIASSAKPIEASVGNMAASAAYGLVSQAATITATSKSASFGSVGVVQSHYASDRVIDITSTNAPKKRPDVTTDEGVAMVREELDAIHDLFAEEIAAGRGKSVKTINSSFGQGGMLLAGAALKAGMIDSIGASSTKSTTAAIGGNQPETERMDLKKLKAEHPDVFAQAVQEGVDKERGRTAAHLKMGDASGGMTIAMQAIEDGTEASDPLTQAEYFAAGLNKRDTEARESDNADASDAVGGASAESGDEQEKQAVSNVFAQAAESCGVELGDA